MALAFEGEQEAAEAMLTLSEMIVSAREAKLIGYHCAICGARDFHFETGITRFKTLEEAKPHLLRSAAAQALTRELLRPERN